MWKKWERLCQMNLDHYNAHPVRHMAYTFAYTAVAGAVVGKFIKKAIRTDMDIHMHRDRYI